MCEAAGAGRRTRPGARPLTRRLHHQDPRKIGRLRGYHRLRPDRRRSFRRASLRNPARHRARHSASRRHLSTKATPARPTARRQGRAASRRSSRTRPTKRQAGLLRPNPLQGKGSHRAGRRTAQALQARSAAMRKDRTKLPINRQLRRRPLLDQIRPHSLAFCRDRASWATSLSRSDQSQRMIAVDAAIAMPRPKTTIHTS